MAQQQFQPSFMSWFNPTTYGPKPAKPSWLANAFPNVAAGRGFHPFARNGYDIYGRYIGDPAQQPGQQTTPSMVGAVRPQPGQGTMILGGPTGPNQDLPNKHWQYEGVRQPGTYGAPAYRAESLARPGPFPGSNRMKPGTPTAQPTIQSRPGMTGPVGYTQLPTGWWTNGQGDFVMQYPSGWWSNGKPPGWTNDPLQDVYTPPAAAPRGPLATTKQRTAQTTQANQLLMDIAAEATRRTRT